MPEHMNRRRLSEEPASKFFQDVIDADKDPMETLDVFLVVRSVLCIFRKRRRRRGFVRDRTDVRLDTELGEIREKAAIEISDCQPVIDREVLDRTVARSDLELVRFEIKLDLEVPAAVRD